MTAQAITPTPPRVILVEDDADTLVMMGKFLDGLPLQNVSVTTCDQARSAARNLGAFDVVIADVGLDDGDGINLVRELKGRYGCHTVVMSGYDAPEDGPPGGVDLWLAKPVDLLQLTHTLHQLTHP